MRGPLNRGHLNISMGGPLRRLALRVRGAGRHPGERSTRPPNKDDTHKSRSVNNTLIISMIMIIMTIMIMIIMIMIIMIMIIIPKGKKTYFWASGGSAVSRALPRHRGLHEFVYLCNYSISSLLCLCICL